MSWQSVAVKLAPSQISDWWDEQTKKTDAFFSEWVEQNPQWWTPVLAAGGQTLMVFAGGFVDVLRFGEGLAEGGFGGVGTDVLRAASIVGPVGKTAGFAGRIAMMSRLRVALQVEGVSGPCGYQAVNDLLAILKNDNAFMKNKSLFMNIREMANALGKDFTLDLTGQEVRAKLSSTLPELVKFVKSLGVKVKMLEDVGSVAQATEVARNAKGVVIFGIECFACEAAKAEQVASSAAKTAVVTHIKHAVIAVRNSLGRVRYADYGHTFYNTLEELVKALGYGDVDKRGVALAGRQVARAGSATSAVVGAAEDAYKLATGAVLILEGLTAIDVKNGGVDLAIPVSLAVHGAEANSDPAPLEAIKGSYQAFRERKNGKPVMRLPPMVVAAGRTKAPPVQWLTGVQYRLNALGFGAGPVDGIMGPLTRGAVFRFQKAYPPLIVDGVPGSETQAKLATVCGY